jgi:uncharacterized protein (TIGR02147 family)
MFSVIEAEMIDVFEYLNYRKLIQDCYEERKQANPAFSYRLIAAKVGFSSPGFFTNIIKGKRNISPEYIFKFAELFKFKKAETEFFELLVLFDQAKNHVQKKYYFERILSHRKSKIKITDAQQYEFYSKWYYTAIREVIDLKPFRSNYEELAKLVSPPITPLEAQKAVEFLETAGFIEKGCDGFYRQADRFISTGYEAQAVAITNFLISTADLAKEAIDRYPRDKRSMATLTLTLSEESYALLHEKLKGFTREIMEIARSEQKPDRVYHVNFHVFPMSKV